MGPLRRLLDKQQKWFEKGGPLERLGPLFEAGDTFLYTPPDVTRTTAHVRDALDLKRMMIVVVVALVPCTLWAMYNAGLQANLALDPARIGELVGWRHAVIRWLGVGYSPDSVLADFVHGALYFLPLYIMTMAVGGMWEVGFAVVRRHPINEGFLVTGLIFPLILPPTTPLWQVAFGITWGVVIAKEVFGGTGMNILNPALVARAAVFYGATILGQARHIVGSFTDQGFSWWDAFIGLEAGSLGETSALMCLIGAAVLLWTKVASWRTMAGVAVGTIVMAQCFNWMGSAATNPAFGIPFWWHMVLGGWAFGTVFMVTDPVTSAFTERGKWIFGFMIGALVVLVRVVNPAYPEAMMLVILFMNVFAPLIDYYVVKGNLRRRLRRRAG
jgi:Na+-transporting NADH:ubiquinone oxidoreductase subunit B